MNAATINFNTLAGRSIVAAQDLSL